MDCNHARLLLEVAHPIATELDARDKEQLAVHLANCPDCGAWAENERLADEHIGKLMTDVPVPDGLKFRLLSRLHRENEAWKRAWLVRAAGVAAVLLLAVGLAYGFWWNRKPTPDLLDFRQQVEARADSADRVMEEFRARGITMTAPVKFDYTLLDSFGITSFQNKQVPYLLFVKGIADGNRPANAKVYVLSDRQFNLEDVRDQPPLPGSLHNIMVLKDAANPHVVYVVVWSSFVGPTPSVFFQNNRAVG